MENIDPRLDALIDAYIDHSIDDASFEMLCDWLREDAAHRQAFARKLSMHSAIAEWCTERSGGALATTQAEPEQAETTSWIDELTSLTEQTETNASPQLASLAGYALRIALTSKLAYQAYAVAAVLLLGVTLFFVFTGNDDATNPTTDLTAIPSEPNSEPGPVSPALTNTFVATLTAEHDAVWKQPGGDHRPGALVQGTQLSAGQRLTLTQGFAEITTARGAVAILQAPATIEFTDHDNALRLHSGKLVGVCETESSQGFLVHTPHLQITDLGTRFGIDADANTTEVHVFEGEVQAERVDAPADTKPITLVATQSARISADTETIARIDHDAQAFTHLLPSEQSPLALNNTDQLRTASNNPFYASGQVDLVGVNFYYSSTSGNPKNNAPRDTPAGPVNGVAFDNIDMWNGATDIAPAPGPYALSANAAGPSLTITAPFTYNDSRSQRSRITGADAKHLRAVADEFLHLDRKSPSITLAFANLGVDEGTPLYVQLIGGDSGWHGGMSISANGASIGAWAVCDRDITTAPLHAFETTAASDGRLTLDLTGTGSFAGLAGVIISAAPGQPTPPEQPRP